MVWIVRGSYRMVSKEGALRGLVDGMGIALKAFGNCSGVLEG